MKGVAGRVPVDFSDARSSRVREGETSDKIGQKPNKVFAESGIKTRQRFEECGIKFVAHAEEGRAQHDAGDAVRVRLRVSQRQCGAPGAADDHPALEGKFLADHFHVRNQMRQRVVFAEACRATAARAALIEQHGVKPFGIEQAAMIGLTAAAGPAMQIDGGNAAFAADALDVNFVVVADR
jgi:hypothetical protein